MKHFLIAILFFCVNPLQQLIAQATETGLPFITNYAPTDYNANTQNWSVVQDQRGLMYFGNNRGVLEYDGTSWRLIPLGNQSIARSLAINKEGTIYVGGVGDFGYLNADSVGQLQFHSLTHLIPKEDRDFSDVWSTVVRGNEVYFQSFTHLYRYADGKIKSWKIKNSYHRIFVVYGQLYVRQAGIGLTVLRNDSLQLVPRGELFAQEVISCMIPFEGKILIGSRLKGLFTYNPITEEMLRFTSPVNKSLAEDQLYHGIQLADGRLAFATINNGLTVMNRDGTLSLRLTRDSGLPYNTIYYLQTDRNNHLWLGSAHGLSRIEISSPLSVFNALLGLDGGTLDIVRFKGSLYVSTHQGVFRLNQDNHFEQVEGINTQAWKLTVYHNPANKDDLHLLAASTGGLFEVKGTSSHLILEGRPVSISNAVSDSSRVFVGLSGQLASLRYTAKGFIKEAVAPFYQDEVRSIQEDREGNLWVGTMYNGLYRITIENWNRFLTGELPDLFGVAKNYSLAEGLPSPNWNYLHLVANRMLVTTQAGIYKYKKSSDSFVLEPVLATALKGKSRWFYYIKEDAEGNLWFDSDLGKGMFLQEGSGYRLVESIFKRMVVAPENQVSGYAEASGIKWFGTPDGLFQYKPELSQESPRQFNVHIRKVILNEDSVIFYGAQRATSSDANSPLEAKLNAASSVNISDQDNQITFIYSASSYENPGSNLYSYYLQGYDKDWSAWSTTNQKEYNNLPPGTYTFKIRSQNFYEVISPEKSYSFTIMPPWHQNPWVYTAYLIVFVGFVGGVAQLNSLRLKRRNNDLEKMVSQRTTQLEAQKTELEKQKVKLERSYKDVTTLSQIGQKITGTLDLESIITTLYHSINSMLPFDSFGIGLYNDQTGAIDFSHAYEGGQELPSFSKSVKDKTQLSVWCFNHNTEVIIGDLQRDAGNYLEVVPSKPSAGKRFSQSVIYVPLSVKDRVIGVITVQNFNRNAYRAYQVDIVKTLAAYTAVALDNSSAYHQLNEINEELNTTLENLKQTQGQLVQSEKMASLGQLTAGVAHEINNPINFVSAGIDSLSINYGELNELLTLYRQLVPGKDCQQQLEEIEKLKQELEIDCLLKEIPELLSSVKSGAQRTTEIVKSLRNFTRLDEENLKQANLEEGLDSTLVILRNKFKDRISINRQYEGIPEIACYPGQLNQAFMNILANAIQAIAGAGTISISTKKAANSVLVIISDSGAGMPEEIRNRIFEPFYTTKDVGEGTGLGLSITYGIIEKHRGTILVDSSPGQGTTFTIELPLTL